MTPQEKYSLLAGNGWSGESPVEGFYTGNTPPRPQLGIPALKMQDAANGFRQSSGIPAGTATAWPSMLALAATWDPELVEEAAASIGREFRGKGANVLLGPSVQVHRTAWGGRNFEYLSGEDPYLGAKLARAYVTGAQSEGVMCVAKHFAFNEQETDRNNNSVEVDERTAWELYYPPFEAAVEAGVGAVMCSYNRVNGTHSCNNGPLLKRDLKGRMHFEGYVMSDWAAAYRYSTAVENGLDQDMPGNDGLLNGTTLSRLRNGSVDEAAGRVLASMYKLKLDADGGCAPPNCTGPRASYQRSSADRAQAAQAAARGVVLLQNAGLLPLGRDPLVRTIAVVGDAAHGSLDLENEFLPDYYTGGGSGHVTPGSVATPLDALARRATDAGLLVVASPSNDVDRAVAAAQRADAVLAIVGASSTEAADRPSLNLLNGADAMIDAVARAKPTAVLLQVPGAVLTPWRGNVSAVLAMFLGGEETGTAWARVVFGDEPPSGKLPVMFPAAEADTIKPSPPGRIEYSEGLFTSYRNPAFVHAYPFGHGLSYTSFDYREPSVLRGSGCTTGAACLRLVAANDGEVPGSETVQVYLEFPLAGPGTPARQLRAFRHTGVLQPKSEQEIVFVFSDRDLSTYQTGRGWVRQATVKAHIGSSSADIRSVVDLTVAA